MKLSGNSYFLIVILVIMPVVIGLSLGMEDMKSKLLPLITGGIIFALASVGLAREILAKGEPGATVTEGQTDRGEGVKKGGLISYLRIGAWIVGFFLAISLLGYIIAIPPFVLFYTKSHGTRWFVAITITIITVAAIYGIFELVLGVALYRGLLFRWLGY